MIRLGIKVPIGREFDGQEYTIKCMDPGVTFAVELHTLEAISPWREMAVPYQIPEGSTAKLRVTRPDRAYTVTKATIEGGTILCPVHPYSVATPGKCAADVAVYGPDGKRLTGATFHFFVDRECAPADGENAPVFVDSIQGLIEFVEQSAERAEAAAERAENAGTGGSAQNPVDPEDIAAAVEDYMAENPVSADVGDGSVSRTKLADDLEPFVGTGDSREAPNQYGYGWYYDHTRRTAANILGEMYRTKLANELADADTIVLEQEGDALAHNICIAEDYANNRIYAVYAVSTDSTDNAGSVNCYVRLSVITNPYTKATRTVEHYKVSGNGQYGDLNIVSGTSDANVYVDTNGMVHIWFNATDVSGVWKIAHCTFNPDTGTFADYEWCTLTVGGGEATQLTGDALTSIDDPSITYQKGGSLQMNGKYCVVDGYIYAGNVCSEVTRNGIILRSPATNCKDWEFVCCPRWQHESHGKCEMSIGDASVYNDRLYIALRQKYQTGASVNERASAPLLVAQADREFNILQEWLVPDCAARPWWIGQSTLIHNPESRHSANVVAIGNNAWPISFERIGYANYLAGFVSNSGWGNRLVLAGTNGVGSGSKVGISILTDTKLIINSYDRQKTSEAAAIEYFKGIGGVTNKALTFTGAVSATYDGTEAVTVNIPQASSGVVIDATLTQSGQAADAKAVGDALSKISDQNVAEHRLKGHTMGIIGDSLSDRSRQVTQWFDWIATRAGGMEISLDCESGRRFMQFPSNTLSDNCDVICVFGGTNDFNSAQPLGTIDDTTRETFYGAVYAMATELRTNYPKALLVFITPLSSAPDYNSGENLKWHQFPQMGGHTVQDFADAIREVCGYLHIPVVDLSRDSGLNYNYDDALSPYFASDKLHLTSRGQEAISYVIEDAILRHYIPNNAQTGNVTSLVSIDAVFTQGDTIITPEFSLSQLRDMLVVTGTYSDGSTKIISGYSLSGTLEEGTSTITVNYSGKTDTFDVVVSRSGTVIEPYVVTLTPDDEMPDGCYLVPNGDGTLQNSVGTGRRYSAPVSIAGAQTIEVNPDNPVYTWPRVYVKASDQFGATIVFYSEDMDVLGYGVGWDSWQYYNQYPDVDANVNAGFSWIAMDADGNVATVENATPTIPEGALYMRVLLSSSAATGNTLLIS